MKIIEHELFNTLSQEFTATKNHDIVAVRPKIYVHNSPAGSLKVQRQDQNGLVIDESNSVAINTISTEPFFHGYVRFDMLTPVKEGEIFKLALVGDGGYSFSQGSFIGWLTDWDLRKYTATYFNPIGVRAPFDVEFWEKRGIGMVRELEFADGFESSSEPETENPPVTLADNVTDQDVTNLVFDSTKFHGAKIWYSLRRANDASEFLETGWLVLKYSIDDAEWKDPGREVTDLKGGDSGVTFGVNNATGQIQYSTTALGGPGYEASMKFSVVVRHSADS